MIRLTVEYHDIGDDDPQLAFDAVCDALRQAGLKCRVEYDEEGEDPKVDYTGDDE